MDSSDVARQLRELREVSASLRDTEQTRDEVRRRVAELRAVGVSPRELWLAVGLSEAQASRLASGPESEGDGLPADTAMELVHLADWGVIDHDSFVEWLKKWPFEPQYRTTGLEDSGEFRDNSFDAADFAFFDHLISEDEMGQIIECAFERGYLPG
ncbi:MAG: hypothetical protein LBS56_03135 [Propionibacteriaceae bacterium]|jgi:hypothetical protein|nr:hypothetical protein [Propionibacteriaceae bacterium]